MKHLLLKSLVASCLLLPTVSCAQETQLPNQAQFHLFVLAGQSNMAGRGKVAATDRKPHPRVLVFNKEGKWAPAVDPLHFDKSIAGVGVGKTFGTILAEADPDVVIGLIPCAVGGSPIGSWEPEGYHPQTRTHPWDDCMKRVRKALPSGTLKGILWHQGESDSNPQSAPSYENKLDAVIKRFRTELKSPEAPFIAGQMGQFVERPWSDAKKMVDKAHRTLPDRVPNTAFVNSDGLGHKGDKVHFSAKAYRELGRRYAKAYQKMTKPSASTAKDAKGN